MAESLQILLECCDAEQQRRLACSQKPAETGVVAVEIVGEVVPTAATVVAHQQPSVMSPRGNVKRRRGTAHLKRHCSEDDEHDTSETRQYAMELTRISRSDGDPVHRLRIVGGSDVINIYRIRGRLFASVRSLMHHTSSTHRRLMRCTPKRGDVILARVFTSTGLQSTPKSCVCYLVSQEFLAYGCKNAMWWNREAVDQTLEFMREISGTGRSVKPNK
jgi:hypothetical protein